MYVAFTLVACEDIPEIIVDVFYLGVVAVGTENAEITFLWVFSLIGSLLHIVRQVGAG